MRRLRLRVSGLGLALGIALALAPEAGAQTSGAVQTKRADPTYPINLLKTQQQGNVMLIGRIDEQGLPRDLVVVATSHKDFEAPALQAVREWRFKPAMRDGKPIAVALNAGVRFRITNEKRGAIPQPILGDLAVMPADAAGKATAPDGFPIRLGKGPALRAEALLDVPPSEETRTLAVRVEALSPKGKIYPIFQPPILVSARQTEVKIPVVAHIGADWEEGVWGIRFSVEGKGAGGGQFWLARDPAHFQFVIPQQ